MLSPKSFYAAAVVALALCLTGCAGFSNAGSSSQTTQQSGGFSVTVTPASASVNLGGNTMLTTTVAVQGGFNSPVTLSLSGLPTGVSGTFSATTITGAGTPTLTIAAASSAAAGTYTVNVSGSAGSVISTSSFSLTVSTSTSTTADFSISASPNSQTVTAGNSTSFTVTIAALNSFTGSVSLVESGMPSGMSAACSPSSITTAGTCTLTVSTTSSTAVGTYTLNVTGTSGSLVHSTSVAVTVNAVVLNPDFSLSASPSSQTITAGNSTSFTVTTAAINSFTGAVGLVESGMPSGMSAACSPSSITGAGTCTLSVSTTSSTAAGTYTLTITGTSGSLVHSTSVTVTVNAVVLNPDFSLSASPSSQTITAGNSTSFTVTTAAINSFAGTVGLVESGMPAGMLASCSPSSITGAGNCTLTISTTSSTAAGTYTLTIAGTSGSLVHSTSVKVTVNAVTLTPDFSFSASPSSQTVAAGNSTTFSASVSPLNGFTGTVSLAASGLPTGVTASFSPTSISTSGSSTLTLTTSNSTTAGAYTVAIAGTSGTLAHNASVSLVVTSSASNFTNCSNQQVPNWQSSTFISNYQAAMAALVNHLKSAPYKNQLGYLRIGLGRGGEIDLPQGWNQSSSGACYASYTTAWGYTAGSTTDNWNTYLQTMVQYESTLAAPFPVLVSITPINGVGMEPDDFIAGIAHQNGISFGNQGLEASDITNYPTCGGDWCNLFAQYPTTTIRELQTMGQSCPSGVNNCPNGNSLTNETGSLASSTPPTLLGFATAHGANDLELYYSDWLVAFESGYDNPVDPNSGQYQTAYANAITTAASSAKMQILFPPTNTNNSDFPGVQNVIASQSNIITGVVLDVDWSDFDPGNGSTSGNYDWTITDAEINLYAAMGVKVNIVLQNSTYGGTTNCPGSGVGSNGTVGNNCAMPAWVWTVLQ